MGALAIRQAFTAARTPESDGAQKLTAKEIDTVAAAALDDFQIDAEEKAELTAQWQQFSGDALPEAVARFAALQQAMSAPPPAKTYTGTVFGAGINAVAVSLNVADDGQLSLTLPKEVTFSVPVTVAIREGGAFQWESPHDLWSRSTTVITGTLSSQTTLKLSVTSNGRHLDLDGRIALPQVQGVEAKPVTPPAPTGPSDAVKRALQAAAHNESGLPLWPVGEIQAVGDGWMLPLRDSYGNRTLSVYNPRAGRAFWLDAGMTRGFFHKSPGLPTGPQKRGYYESFTAKQPFDKGTLVYHDGNGWGERFELT